MKISRFSSCGFAILLAATSVSFAGSTLLQFESTFESGDLNLWEKVRTNVPVVSSERARAGRNSMKVTLDIANALLKGGERNEMKVRSDPPPMNSSQWYGFSVFLPSNYVADSVWELIAQWYPVQDASEELGRQPTMAIFSNDGKWSLGIKYSPDRITPMGHPSIKTKNWDVGTHQLNKWTDWVINVSWSSGSDGFIKAWIDGKVVLDYKGPTSYNDASGPVWKLGIYKGWPVGDGTLRLDKATVRTLYIDEVRIAGRDASYATVAPGGAKVTAIPKAPSNLSIQ